MVELRYPLNALAFDYLRGVVGLGISILSYNGAVHFGLIADARLMPDPDSVIRRFQPEFEKLLYLALMAKWEGEFCAEAAEALMVEAG